MAAHLDAPGPSGALLLWQEELCRGVSGQDSRRPSTWQHDALWRAACWESSGLDALRDGFPRIAEHRFRQADEVIERAFAKQNGRAA